MEKRAACLGPKDSFSEFAAHRMCEGFETVLCHSFREAVEKTLSGEADCAVLPVENSLNGGVLECLDLLQEKEVFGVEEYLLPVDQRLATLEGVKWENIRRICSHEQAIGQCSEFLARYFPGARFVHTSSTVESLSLLDGETAGIVGSHVKGEGVVLSRENIADHKGNFTRFLKVVPRGELPERSNMVFFCALCHHRPGSLVGLLKIFLRYGLNLTRIESRPVKEAFGECRFFIEFAGDIGNDRVKSALSEAKNFCLQFKILGAYN